MDQRRRLSLFGVFADVLPRAQEIGNRRLRALAPRGASATAGRSATTIARSCFRDFISLRCHLGLFDRNLYFLNLKWVIGHLRRLSLERLARRFDVAT